MRKYREGILNFIDSKLTNARLEGMNNKIRLLGPRGFGVSLTRTRPSISAARGLSFPGTDDLGDPEFVGWQKMVDAHYSETWKIRVILDKPSAHISKAPQAYLPRFLA